jgi:hypothetical protein
MQNQDQDQTNRLSVRTEDLIEFSPIRLGRNTSALNALLDEAKGLRQSEIITMLRRTSVAAVDADADDIALAFVLEVLADYVEAGYYPVTRSNRRFLAPVSIGPAVTQDQQRRFLRRSYAQGRIQAIRARGMRDGIARDLELTVSSAYDPAKVSASLGIRPPMPNVIDANTSPNTRARWRCVRNTWSMAPDRSAPGREVSILVEDSRIAGTPLGIIQLRNTVPEIRTRDLWLGITSDSANYQRGYVGEVLRRPEPSENLIRETQQVLRGLLQNVIREGIATPLNFDDIGALREIEKSSRESITEARRQGAGDVAKINLAVAKRASTAVDLLRGIKGLDDLAGEIDTAGVDALSREVIESVNAGLRKIWHYHMGFVAIELSVCGASPPFGPLRTGKLMAALAGSSEVVNLWGTERPLGDIARTVYRPEVRESVPNPGPLVIFTSGLYPGHSAQYTRVKAGNNAWRKIGDTVGYGSFHISEGTIGKANQMMELADGYKYVSNVFGEGASARFRMIGRALNHLSLPDLRKHSTQRPIYAMSLVEDPQGVILGWARPERQLCNSAAIAEQWWRRWVRDRYQELAERAASERDVTTAITDLLAELDGQPIV